MTCGTCGSGNTAYVAEAFADICTNCGTLVDAQQVELYVDSTNELEGQIGRSYYAGPSTLKGVYGNRSLAGQGNKELYDRNNKNAAHKAIQNLLTSLQHPGLVPRARNVFDQSMKAGQFRWGKTSKLVEGAAVAVALRENDRSETLIDIAVRLSVSLTSLARMFGKIKTLLSLNLPPNDAVLLLPNLLKTISTLAEAPSELAPALQRYLQTISITDVSRFAASLSALCQRVSLTHQRAASPVACALVIAAFEGVCGRPMPEYHNLIAKLASQIGFAKTTIMERYREIGRLVHDWKTNLPWVDSAKNKSARGVAGRESNARWMKDVVTFQQSLWKASLGHTDSPAEDSPEVLLLDDDSDDTFFEVLKDSDETPTDFDATAINPAKTAPQPADEGTRKRVCPARDPDTWMTNAGRPDAYVRRLKRPEAYHRKIFQDAAASVLSYAPHSSSSSQSSVPASSASHVLRSQLLADPSSLYGQRVLSRLAMLAASKGGEQFVDDDDLFEPGEMDALFRDEEEMEALKDRWAVEGMSLEEEDINGSERDGAQRNDVLGELGSPSDWDAGLEKVAEDTEEIVGDWRPLSP
ncbi:hypothetical protein BS47DRAFT_1481712 [Hydnum rufescens UP504]|uniref:B-related factor 1 n=1 Tax=Hydnum rufescens UP504 TaxID=1448309 RepID=A0A9P6E1S7_9AGAM|nr:hypothetical protein BS47DRAFT_1481712 [Hydnum rufescens UP504]